MTTRIDWIAIRSYFLAYDTITLRECSDRFGICYGTMRQKASDEGWSYQKQRIRNNALALLDERTTEELAERNRKQIQFAQALLAEAAQALSSGIRPQNAKEIKMWVETGVRIERICLGMK